jgi:hypothetical protein
VSVTPSTASTAAGYVALETVERAAFNLRRLVGVGELDHLCPDRTVTDRFGYATRECGALSPTCFGRYGPGLGRGLPPGKASRRIVRCTVPSCLDSRPAL